jgi:ABC-type dipeptide/oligopeptide/nickel transport system permease component
VLLRYVARRLIQVPASLLLVSLVVFVLVRATGDPVGLYLGPEAPQDQVVALQKELGLDQPLWAQYGHYLVQLAHGDMGTSLRLRQPALEVVLGRLPLTFELALAGLVIGTLVGVAIGVLSAWKRGTWLDTFLVTLAASGQSVPSFWLGVMLIVLFAVQLHVLPTSGVGDWRNLVLPSVTLASFVLPHMTLLTRTAMLDVLQEPYVVVARAKGLREDRVMLVHVFRNALNPLIAYIGLQFGTLMGGSIITETIFAWPGVGQLTIQAIFNRDAPVVVTAVLVLALIIIVCNLAADVANAFADPRIRVQ